MELKKESMTVTLTNEADENREYTIRGAVHVSDGKYASADNGSVFDTTGAYVANFNAGQDESLSIRYQDGTLTDAQRVSVLNLIQDFIASAKAEVNEAME